MQDWYDFEEVSEREYKGVNTYIFACSCYETNGLLFFFLRPAVNLVRRGLYRTLTY